MITTSGSSKRHYQSEEDRKSVTFFIRYYCARLKTGAYNEIRGGLEARRPVLARAVPVTTTRDGPLWN